MAFAVANRATERPDRRGARMPERVENLLIAKASPSRQSRRHRSSSLRPATQPARTRERRATHDDARRMRASCGFAGCRSQRPLLSPSLVVSVGLREGAEGLIPGKSESPHVNNLGIELALFDPTL